MAPADDTGHAQRCTPTNGGDEIHLVKPREPAAVGQGQSDLFWISCWDKKEVSSRVWVSDGATFWSRWAAEGRTNAPEDKCPPVWN